VFSAVGRARRFPSPQFWTRDDDGLLFLFHLHGFADLAAYGAGSRTLKADAFWTRVLENWLDECSSPSRPAWHPFPMSGRIIAWCAALSAGGWDPQLAQRMRESLAMQARVLRRSVEHEIGGNHVLRNAAALTFAGVCLREPKLERLGLRLLRRELEDQVLPDGGHEERSPSYHRAVLADLQDLRILEGRAGRDAMPWLDHHVERMSRWLALLAGPDGSLPLLNDAWEGPPIAQATDSFADLEDSGYVVVRGEGLQAVLDDGPVAPPHLPPHAHADVLSFVLWVDGEPVIVDPGVSSYGGTERDEYRATRAHNTVEVDGVDQCVFWGDFRASYMPRVRRLRLDRQDGVVVISAEHDGYRRLRDPVIHRRTFVWIPDAGLLVVDKLIASESHDAASFLHLARGAELRDGQVRGTQVLPLGGDPDLTVEQGHYAPFLGTAHPTQILVRRRRVQPGEAWGWALLRAGLTASLKGGVARVARPGRATLALTVD